MNGHRTPPPSAPIDIPSAPANAPGDQIDITDTGVGEWWNSNDEGVGTVDVRDLLEYPSGAMFPISIPSPRSHGGGGGGGGGGGSELPASRQRTSPQTRGATSTAASVDVTANMAPTSGAAVPSIPHSTSAVEHQTPPFPDSRATLTLSLGGDPPIPDNMTGTIVWLATPTPPSTPACAPTSPSNQEAGHGVSGAWSGVPPGIGGNIARYGRQFPQTIGPGGFGCWVGARVMAIVMELESIDVWVDEFGVARGQASYGVTGEWNGNVELEWGCSWLQAGDAGESGVAGSTD